VGSLRIALPLVAKNFVPTNGRTDVKRVYPPRSDRRSHRALFIAS
jgi:hypothetical protein